MSTKVRMRCARCGKSFRSSAKQTLCPDCEAKERRARAAAKTAPATSVAAAPAPIRPPKIVGPGAGILVPGLAQLSVPAAVEPPRRAQTSAQAAHEQVNQPTPEQRPAVSPGAGKIAGKGGQSEGERQRKPRQQPLREAKPHREPTPPFTLTDELRTRIEARYLELAQPVEFDGIRTQIATELSVPKAAVKKSVLELRQRMQMPSWWELQSYKGSDQDLVRIRQAYVGYLPVPPIGIHKVVAEELSLEPLAVYQGIRRIRAEMHLPQFNPPELHQEMHGAAPETAQTAAATDGGPATHSAGVEASQSTADVTTPAGEAR
ncbi:MAG TPA: hypothetical protein VGS80_20060 [Ktedonobacterales bacterium]|nr:hypothetical protein [Ktedonobacterales bacterium]